MAIDPGVSGGVAVAAMNAVTCHAMPDTEGDRLELIRSFKTAAEIEGASCVCVLEEVSGFVGKAQPGSAMFKFGEHYGFIKGVVQALGIKLVLVRPQVWQKSFGLGTASRCASQSDWKNKLKAEAQRRFPAVVVTLKTSDALLILEWAQAAQANGTDRKFSDAVQRVPPNEDFGKASGVSPEVARGTRALPGEQKQTKQQSKTP
ncbi:MAG: hypothetical protein U1F83_18950 [Verrucomicrobiota bacterium]